MSELRLLCNQEAELIRNISAYSQGRFRIKTFNLGLNFQSNTSCSLCRSVEIQS